jgi:UDP-N-acetylglucosamine 2-epimerase
VLRVNLDHLVYWALLRDSACIAGNSSSGIMEAASFGIPAVNVGVRQQGRTRARNVVDCAADVSEIQAAIHHAMGLAFRNTLSGMVNPYGTGHAAEVIVKSLASTQLGASLLQKKCDR